MLSDVEKMRVGACVRACVRVHVLATVKLRKEERKLLTGFQLQEAVVAFIWESWSIVLFHILHSKYSWVVVTKMTVYTYLVYTSFHINHTQEMNLDKF